MENPELQADTVFACPVPLEKLKLKREDMEKAMGYKPGEAPAFLEEELDVVFRDLDSFTDLYGGFKILTGTKLSLTDKGFALGEVFFNAGKVIAANLQDSEYLAIFLATAGNKISRRITEANQAKDFMQAYLYDTAGSEIVEYACDYIQAILETTVKAMGRGLGITNRYSPGYCGWSVAEQHKLFSFLPAGFCGITLTASSLMLPLKSVSGIIGIGRGAVKKAYGCAICTLKSCYKRKLKNP